MKKRKSVLLYRIISAVLVLMLSVSLAVTFSGCSSSEDTPKETQQVQVTEREKTATKDEDSNLMEGLYCHGFSSYSGEFVENSKGEKVENIVSALIENRSDRFLDKAIIKYKCKDKTATFILSNLPAGKKCRALEVRKMTFDKKDEFAFVDCNSTFIDDEFVKTDKLEAQRTDKGLTAKNISMKPLKNIRVYYKNLDDDGNYLGGITYKNVFSYLAPGESFSKETARFSDSSEIVRYGFVEE